MSQPRICNVANMSFKAIHENKNFVNCSKLQYYIKHMGFLDGMSYNNLLF